MIWRATFCTAEFTFFSLLIVLKLITWLGTGFSTQHSFFTAAYLSSLGVGITAQTSWTEGSTEFLMLVT